jgi:hypothetical protein
MEDSTAMTADRHAVRRAVAVVLAVVAALTLIAGPAVANIGLGPGTRVAASSHDLGTSIGVEAFEDLLSAR